MLLRGGCCCGAIRYEAVGEPFHVTICHCPTCRRASGAASVAWFSVKADGFRIGAGVPAQFSSSAAVTRGFCGACGTQLTYQRSDTPDEIDVTLCSLDEPEALTPRDHTFTAFRLRWDRSADGLPHHARLRPQPGGKRSGV